MTEIDRDAVRTPQEAQRDDMSEAIGELTRERNALLDALAAAEARADRAEAAIGRAIERKHFNQDCGWDVPLIELAEWDKEEDQ